MKTNTGSPNVGDDLYTKTRGQACDSLCLGKAPRGANLHLSNVYRFVLEQLQETIAQVFTFPTGNWYGGFISQLGILVVKLG